MRIHVLLALGAAALLAACSSEDDSGGTAGGGGSGGGGATCDEATDCGDPTTMVCDPVQGRCVAGQCTNTVGCKKGETCRLQQQGAAIGACYLECVFNGRPCPGDATCRVSPNDNSGFCWNAGAATEGQSCQSTPVNTGCALGLVCAIDAGQNVCREQCSYWSASPGCPSSQHCAANSLCFAQSGDSAAIGESCASGATAGDPCGSDGGAWRGSCVSDGAGHRCTKVCRVAVSADCPSGKTCQLTAGDDVGLCL